MLDHLKALRACNYNCRTTNSRGGGKTRILNHTGKYNNYYEIKGVLLLLDPARMNFYNSSFAVRVKCMYWVTSGYIDKL